MRKRKIYPDFAASTGYGTGAGLCGWNCRHSFGPYVEGAPRVWTDEKLAELNEPKYEYNGEKLTEYEAQQKENYFNRQIHRWNREAEAICAAGQDASEAMAKAREWRARKKDFLEKRTDNITTNTTGGYYSISRNRNRNLPPGRFFRPFLDGTRKGSAGGRTGPGHGTSGPMWAYIRDSSSSAPTGASKAGGCGHPPQRVRRKLQLTKIDLPGRANPTEDG